jgi:hypothetical protein
VKKKRLIRDRLHPGGTPPNDGSDVGGISSAFHARRHPMQATPER